jgi:hypothetical protein
MTRLAELCDRYGEAIAADLAMLGWDLVELVEQGRWAFTLNLVEHLPRASYYAEAVLQDDEYAEQVAAQPSRRVEMPVHQWTPELEALAVMVDRLAHVANAVVASAGGRPGRVDPYPRPVTAIDRARSARSRKAVEEMAARLWPDGE